MRPIRLVLAAVLSLFAVEASAHEGCECFKLDWKPYAGLVTASSEFSDWERGVPSDGSFNSGFYQDYKDQGFGFFAGIEPLKYLGLEAAYFDFGEASYGATSDGSGGTWAAGRVSETITTTAYDVSLIGRLPLTQAWTIFARAGVSNYHAKWIVAGTTQANGPVRAVNSDQDQAQVLAAGIEYRGLGPWRVLASWAERTIGVPNIRESANLESLSLAVGYSW